jgi:DNA invertase Pin-like site-specific DNA recombinase
MVVAGMIEYLIRKRGGKVKSISDVADDNTPEGMLLNSVLDLFTQFEKQLIMLRTKAGLTQKRAKGERCGEIVYGKQVGADGKTLIDNDNEQAVIAAIRTWHSEGKRQAAIVRMLEADGYTSRAGKPLRLIQVQRIMQRHSIA